MSREVQKESNCEATSKQSSAFCSYELENRPVDWPLLGNSEGAMPRLSRLKQMIGKESEQVGSMRGLDSTSIGRDSGAGMRGADAEADLQFH